jgi:hypothetical protein
VKKTHIGKVFELTLLAQSKPAPRKASNLITLTSSLHLTAKK